MTLRSRLVYLTLALLTVGCSPRVSTPAQSRREVVVFAASSLTDVLADVKAQVERRSPDLQITINFGASSVLRTQLEQGARADLLITADDRQMQLAADRQLLAAPATVVASNRLVIIVPAKNPGNVAAAKDLARPGLRVVTTSNDVPIGHYARQSLANMDRDPAFGADFSARVLANVVSEETNVRAVVAKIQLGEGDAAIVYNSDVTAGVRDQLRVIPIPDAFNVVARYPAALLASGQNQAGARVLVDYLVSPDGQADFKRFGFLPANTNGPGSPSATP